MGILFLEGPKGIGKSTLILETAEPYRKLGCGIFSQRMNDEVGRTRGFRLIPYREADESITRYSADCMNGDQVFLRFTESGREVNMEVFARVRKLMKGYENARFLVLDEIGGMELSMETYRKFLYEVLGSGIPCIGVMKSPENFNHMKRHVTKETEEAQERYWQLRRDIEEQFGGEILRMERRDDEKVRAEVREFFEELTREDE